MRVLYASWGYSVHDRRFLAAYADAGFDVAHVRLNPGNVTEGRPRPAGVIDMPLDRQAAGDALDSAVEPFTSAVESFRPDLVHAGPVTSVAWVAVKAGATPLIAMSWGSDLLLQVDRDSDADVRAAHVLSRAQALQCDCIAVRDVAVGRYGFTGEIVQFPWGIDTTVFSPADTSEQVRTSLGAGPDDVLVLSNRTWDSVYGVDTAVRAFAAAKDSEPRLKLALAGDGRLAAELHALVDELGIADAVTMPGRVSNDALPDVLRASDIYLACSHSDGSSISLLEAMGCGRPAVVSDIPGNREWIVDGDGGYLAAPDDAPSFASCLLRLAADGTLRERFGERNRRVIEQRADWPGNVKMLIEAASRLGR